MLVQRVVGACTPKLLTMKCIHRDVKEYRKKKVTLEIEGLEFTCRADIIPQLKCHVLLSRDCRSSDL